MCSPKNVNASCGSIASTRRSVDGPVADFRAGEQMAGSDEVVHDRNDRIVSDSSLVPYPRC